MLQQVDLPRELQLRRPATVDVLLGTAALAFGSLSVTYPFAHDQALYAYVAREWVERGAIPYRDVFDHKTPGIYLVHALACILFGETMWGIRVLDLAGVLATGIVVARIATPFGERPARGIQGFACLLMSIFHYGFFDYWNTGQSELWYSLLGLTTIHHVTRIRDEARAQWMGGFFAGMTLVMKPTGIWFVLIAVFLLVERSRVPSEDRAKRVGLGVARFAIGGLLPIAAVLAYFGAHHALSSMLDIVVRANSFYVEHDRGVHSLTDVLSRCRDVSTTLSPLMPVLLLGLLIQVVRAARTHDHARLRRYALAAACVGAALAAVAMQMKFYWLHWMVIVGPLTLVGTNLAIDLLNLESKGWHANKKMRIAGCAAIAILLFATNYSPSSYWLDQQKMGFLKITHRIDRETFDDYFVVRRFYYFYRDMDDVARWIDANSTPADTIVVRGFNPEIYILSHRHYDGRFFWTNFLVGPERAYRRSDFLEEEERSFRASKPRFAVALSLFHEGIDSPEWHEARGYRVCKVIGAFTVLEPSPAAP